MLQAENAILLLTGYFLLKFIFQVFFFFLSRKSMEELGSIYSVTFTSNLQTHLASGKETSVGTCSLYIRL